MKAAVSCLALVIYLTVGAVNSEFNDDSLRGALNAVSQRRKSMLAQSRDYEPDEYGRQDDANVFSDSPNVDGRPVGPDYIYGRRDASPYSRLETNYEPPHETSRSLEDALLDYLNNFPEEDVAEMKRSVFRELAEQPDAIERFAPKNKDENRDFLTTYRKRNKLRENYDTRQNVLVNLLDDDAANTNEYVDFLHSLLQQYMSEEDIAKMAKDYLSRTSFRHDDGNVRRFPEGPKMAGHHIMRKRVWCEGCAEGVSAHERALKRPMLKRTGKSSFYSSQADGANMIRRKKNVRKTNTVHMGTDPTTMKELYSIYPSVKENNHTTNNKTEKAVKLKEKLDVTTKPPITEKNPTLKQRRQEEDPKTKSKAKQKSGQPEEASGSEGDKTPVAMTKKSVDWSDYFGIDRRRKKAHNNEIDDNWLLGQYLQAYGQDEDGKLDQGVYGLDKPANYDYVIERLKHMADAIVNRAIKYTGAHEGIGDPELIEKVKQQVINQLATAYHVESVRRALENLKEERYPHDFPLSYSELADMKKKRVSVKKEKVTYPGESTRLEEDNRIAAILASSKFPSAKDNGACTEVKNLVRLCKNIINETQLIAACVISSHCRACSKITEETGAPAKNNCYLYFVHLAQIICGDSENCKRSAAQAVHPMSLIPPEVIITDPDSCLSDSVAEKLGQCF